MKSLISKSLTIPRLGFGTFRMPGDGCQAVVESAIEVGYRHIDTAAMYDNEASVGRALAASGIARSELFVTTKVWHDQLEPTALLKSFDTSLSKLGLEYVDLYMVHWPSASMDMAALMKTLGSLRDSGRIRELGVCNFNMPMLRTAIDELGASVAAVQVEYHPFLDQTRLLTFLRERNIPLVAYAPLAQGRAASDPTLMQIGAKHDVSAAQVAIAWLLDQDGVIAIPKAQRAESQKANLEALAVKLDDEDRQAIASLAKDQRFVQPPFAPDWDAK
ncbi:aldo/keto reductase [Pseudomonas sp. 10B1]|uniref:aldo/keto reductase n=1 Tax=unclassified Pseudomonas TaxID=196821 RepID=UPI002AB3CAA2|nr:MULTISPECIES: aldo/keto reductase [unclassified Pseudomonas]MDY7561365.1 aldo/keto reductase [Pseudomonas sp. AB6]MEA9978493.1 aldo/keto reductase [Pseudomonas sp. RTS4]MEA9996762.1 aldo/keto reductase [Pseudomonas sp. AA4]MEB0088885.1 aldo/keto reductase [Pseudomonas sp. RTI1]MEB0128268.1 aldo/keto reductase [Pseudomonas sp. CCC1.2]